MGLFGFGAKKQKDAELMDEIRNSNFGTLVRMVHCIPIKGMQKVCASLNCSARFTFVPVPDHDAIANYAVYTMKIVDGVINADDNAGMLNYILTRDKDERIELLMKNFGFTEEEARNFDIGGIRYSINDYGDTIEFSSDSVMSYLKYSDVYFHLKVLGQIVHEQVPNAYVLVNYNMVFVMLNGNESGKYEEK